MYWMTGATYCLRRNFCVTWIPSGITLSHYWETVCVPARKTYFKRDIVQSLHHCIKDFLTTDLVANFPSSKVGLRCSSRRSSHGNDTWWHTAFLSVLEFLFKASALEVPKKNVDPKVVSQVFEPWFVALKNNILGSRYTWRHHTFHQELMKCQFVRNPIGTSYADQSLSPFARRLKASKTTCAWTRLIFVYGLGVLVGWLVMKNAYLGFQVYLMAWYCWWFRNPVSSPVNNISLFIGFYKDPYFWWFF